MNKGDVIIKMIGEVAVQAEESNLRLEERLSTQIKEVRSELSEVKQDVSVLKQDVTILKHDVAGLKQDVRELRGDMLQHHDEVIGYLKTLTQEQVFIRAHLVRHDEQIEELQKKVGLR